MSEESDAERTPAPSAGRKARRSSPTAELGITAEQMALAIRQAYGAPRALATRERTYSLEDALADVRQIGAAEKAQATRAFRKHLEAYAVHSGMEDWCGYRPLRRDPLKIPRVP